MNYALELSADPALKQTQMMLENKDIRDVFIKEGGASSRSADAQLEALVGPSIKEDVYAASSEVLSEIVERSKGDPATLQKIVQDAQSNPKAFLDSLSSENKELIRSIAADLEKPSAQP